MLCHLAEYARHPRSIGAIVPSSRALATAMTASVPLLHERDVILELGSGTGAITRELVSAFPQNHIIAVEKNRRLAAMLRRRFAEIEVAELCASAIGRDLVLPSGYRIGAVVSSLPMISFDPVLRRRVLTAIRDVLDPRAVFIQFTYSASAWDEFAADTLDLVGRIRIMRNTPPATVLSFRNRLPLPVCTDAT
jgi:phospholipid N-methyltransferase